MPSIAPMEVESQRLTARGAGARGATRPVDHEVRLQIQQDQQGDIVDGSGRTAGGVLDLSETLSAFFAFPAVNMWLLISVFVMQYDKVTSMSWCSIVSLVSLGLSFILHLVLRDTSTRNSIQDVECTCCKITYMVCKIAYISTVLRMVAAASLLLLLGTADHLLVVLPLLLLVLALVAMFSWQTFSGTATPGFKWRQHKGELKVHFDLSSKVVSMAFAGLNGTVIGYVKGPSNLTSGYMAPECFLFYSAVLGLLVALLCTVPIRIVLWETIPRMAKVYIPILSYVALLFLVLAGIMAAEEILREYIFAVCFAIIAVGVWCFWYDSQHGVADPSDQVEEDTKYSQYLLVVCFTPLFGLLMAARLKYGNGSSTTAVSLSLWFKAFVFWVVYGILNYAARMVVFAEVRGINNLAFPKITWTLATYLSLAGTIICASFVGFLHPEEIKNVF